MTMIYDITRTITPDLAVWPGDTPYSYEVIARISEGSSVNLTTWTHTAHLGTHMDAPFHYDDAGEFPADVPLDLYMGPARVASIDRRIGGIVPADFGGLDITGVERFLIRTWVSEHDMRTFPEDFPYPTVELVDWLADHGVKLLGVDMPSVDGFHSKTLDSHNRLYERGLFNLETLLLKDVPDGDYELIALPLKIDAVCGSPVRAILRQL